MTTHVADCSVTNCSFNDHTNCKAAATTPTASPMPTGNRRQA